MFLFAVPFNGLFLIYVAGFAFGFWGLVALLTRVPFDTYAASFTAALAVPAARRLDDRLLRGVLCAVAQERRTRLVRQRGPGVPGRDGMVTATNYVLDMALFLPFTIVVAAGLWRRTPSGLVVGGSMLLMLTLESIAIAVDRWFGSAAEPLPRRLHQSRSPPVFLVVAADQRSRVGAVAARDCPSVTVAGACSRLTGTTWFAPCV